MDDMAGNQGLYVVLLSGNLVRKLLDLLVLGEPFLELGKLNTLTEVEIDLTCNTSRIHPMSCFLMIPHKCVRCRDHVQAMLSPDWSDLCQL